MAKQYCLTIAPIHPVLYHYIFVLQQYVRGYNFQ